MRDITLTPFRPEHIDEAAGLFVAEFTRLRSVVPALPETMAHTRAVTDRLAWLFGTHPPVIATREGRVVGYLGWIAVDDFRDTGRRAAHCPAWAHAAVPHGRERIYHLLYGAAAREWTDAGCATHAVTLLAHETDAVHAFFLNGFGVTVIDAVRAVDPIAGPTNSAAVRRTTGADLDTLVVLESEHRRHYRRPPILMPERAGDLVEIRRDLIDCVDTTWLAEVDEAAVGFLRFEPTVRGAADLLASSTTAAISGAYVRPAHRGHGIATALLDAALAEYSAAGFTACSVDFESFNPEARAFWLRHFAPVCLSVIRHPEALTGPVG